MTDPTDVSPQDPGGPTEDELRALMEQLRTAPAAQILADLFSSLLSTAQVKLGRRDARLFIDLCAQAVQHAGPYLPEALTGQVEAGLNQLRLAQVTAEAEAAKTGAQEPDDLERLPTPPPTTGDPPPGASAASGLWVPDR